MQMDPRSAYKMPECRLAVSRTERLSVRETAKRRSGVPDLVVLPLFRGVQDYLFCQRPIK